MSDFLAAVATRAIGGPIALRPAVQPSIAPEQGIWEVAAPRHPGSVDDQGSARAGPGQAGMEVDAGRTEPAPPRVQSPTAESRRRQRRPSRVPADRAAPDDGSRVRPVEPDAAPVDAAALQRESPDASKAARRTDVQREAPSRRRTPAPSDLAVEGPAPGANVGAAPAPGRPLDAMRTEAPARRLAAVAIRADDRPWNSKGLLDADDNGPVVHVSIGRVEVRAAPPPVNRAAPTPIAPRLTLDAYLNRRDGGER